MIVLIFAFSLCLVSLNILSASNGTTVDFSRIVTTDSHGSLSGKSTGLITEPMEEFNSNISFATTVLPADNDTTGDYWDISNQRGIMKRQNLRFRKIGSKGNTFAAALLPCEEF